MLNAGSTLKGCESALQESLNTYGELLKLAIVTIFLIFLGRWYHWSLSKEFTFCFKSSRDGSRQIA